MFHYFHVALFNVGLFGVPLFNVTLFNPIQDGGGGQKGPPTCFSPVTSINVGISPENFLTVNYDPFATLV